ncbi:uncharacterized protein [Euphorbia lathyris]|uniref:uncharacterized protein isoform X1 n=1 Tax=Euphorbia lathyris TaxID=212925 RepID=UPI0033134924
MASEHEKSSAGRQLSLKTCFDDLWFCYSPVHQLQQYYRIGYLDNCSGKWRALMDSLLLKTKKSSEVQEMLDAKAKTHIWTFRTREEASAYWTKLYGHLDKETPVFRTREEALAYGKKSKKENKDKGKGKGKE